MKTPTTTTKEERKAHGRTWSQVERRDRGGKEVVSMMLSAEAKAALDLLRGAESRGEFVEELLRKAMR